jgi:tryptophanyl-tRNA synthetase
VPGENWCECLRTGLALSGVTTSDTFLFLASLETLTFASRLTAVETNLYVSERFRSFLAHGLQTTCRLLYRYSHRLQFSLADIRMLFRFEICKCKAIYII